MGSVCSGQKPKAKAVQAQQDINEQPYLEVSSIPQSSRPLELQNTANLDDSVRDLLILFKKFTDLLGLVGNLDQLPQHTREKLNSCIILRSNISIIISNNIKRIMREQQIIKRVEESDNYLLHKDEKFTFSFTQQMQRLSNIILTDLKEDQDFESSFPILIVSFEEIAQKIVTITSTLKKIPIRKGSAQQQLSVEPKTTKKPPSLQ